MTCPCGEKTVHQIAHRRTADERLVLLWSNGDVTTAMGFAIRGVGAPRGAYECEKGREAAWIVAGLVEWYEFSEVAALVHAARRAVRQTSLSAAEYVRRAMAGEHIRRVGRGAVVVTIPAPSPKE